MFETFQTCFPAAFGVAKHSSRGLQEDFRLCKSLHAWGGGGRLIVLSMLLGERNVSIGAPISED